MMKTRTTYTLMLSLLLHFGLSADAAVQLSSFFQDNMVLQRGMPVPVWGKALPGDAIHVTFAGQTHSAKAGEDGRWRVQLDPLTASGEGATLEVVDGPVCTNVLVGDVWLLSGQSNMAFGLAQSYGGREAAQQADYPWLRLLTTAKVKAEAPCDSFEGTWEVCTPKTVNWFSAVGFYFARKMHDEVGVPIGLIQTAWSGAAIDPFIPAEGFASEPTLTEAAQRKEAGHIYNSRVHPLIPMAMTGVLWYQGESNGTDSQYLAKMRALIAGWRQLWNREFPFYYVQIANWPPAKPNPYAPREGWAICREAQLQGLSIPRTGMAVTIDIGEGELHPKDKLDVGLRLARWALHDLYGRKELEVSGPLYEAFNIEGDRIAVSFTHFESDLVAGRKPVEGAFEETPGEPLHEFEIAGEDRVWHSATATIEGSRVVVSSPSVPVPVAVRYAFSQNPAQANLYNRAGLPASPFRTDGWPLKIRQP